ncbi:MAG: hypothetical protein KDD66_09410 [Bdellovibrionales bacterium]|nr:hypothetical protein [Bdellovibrionales bacterium]
MLKLCSLSCDRGATIAELLIASMVGLVLVSLTHSVILANHRLYQVDIVRTELNQNLRSALDILAANARETGERLPATFPALLVTDGGATPDEMVIRRNLLDEVLVVCQDLTSGSSNSWVMLSDPLAGNPACTYPSQSTSYNSWSTYRTDEGGIVDAYIVNLANGEGEFFKYDSEQDFGGDLMIHRDSGNWQHDYPAEFSAIYILEEWDVSVVGDFLQLVVNQDSDNPRNIVYGIEDFQVQVAMQDTTVMDGFAISDDWVDIQSIDLTLSGQTTYKGQDISASLTSKFFPRNILSN